MKLTPEQIEEAAGRLLRGTTRLEKADVSGPVWENYCQTAQRLADTIGPVEPTAEAVAVFMHWMGPPV